MKLFWDWLWVEERVIPLGQCFQYAYQWSRKYGGVIVHGTVHDPWDGHALEHAWVEKGGKVYEWQNMEVRGIGPMALEKYYATWKPTHMRRFDDEQAMVSLARHGHYGPWAAYVSWRQR